MKEGWKKETNRFCSVDCRAVQRVLSSIAVYPLCNSFGYFSSFPRSLADAIVEMEHFFFDASF
jgi:hypothetical protein